MSSKGIEDVLNRAMSDAAFGDLLFADLEQALAGFELTAEEASKFKGLSRAEFEALMSSPEERKSFGALFDQRGGWDGNHNETALSLLN